MQSSVKTKTIQIAAAAAAAAGMFLAVGWSFFELMVHCKKKNKLAKKRWFSLSHTKINHPRYKYGKEYEEGKAWCREQKMQDCYIRSQDGLLLHALYLPAKKPERFVLLSHGYKGSGFGDFAYTARFLHEHGCNLLFIDQRCCGQSEGEFITFGAKEQYDVVRWAFMLAKNNGRRLPIYLYGESMGAAAVLMASAHRLPREVKGIIADCGFRSMKEELKEIAVNWFHIKWVGLLLFRVDLFCRLFGGFRMKDADTEQAMQTNRLPVLFFHGAMDTYVDPKNSKHNYAMCRAQKELIIVPEARHLCSAYAAKDLYREKLLEFFAAHDSQ